MTQNDIIQLLCNKKLWAQNNKTPVGIKQFIVCPVCEGEGTQTHFDEFEEPDGFEPCNTCSGNKLMKVTVNIKYEKIL